MERKGSWLVGYNRINARKQFGQKRYLGCPDICSGKYKEIHFTSIYMSILIFVCWFAVHNGNLLKKINELDPPICPLPAISLWVDLCLQVNDLCPTFDSFANRPLPQPSATWFYPSWPYDLCIYFNNLCYFDFSPEFILNNYW